MLKTFTAVQVGCVDSLPLTEIKLREAATIGTLL